MLSKQSSKMLKAMCIVLIAVIIPTFSIENTYSEPTSESTEAKLKNGSFENISVTLGNQYIQTDQSNVDYWSTTATDGKIELFKKNKGIYIKGVTLTPSHPDDGKGLAAELNADEESTLYQVVKTSPSSIYEWGLDHGARNGTDTMALIIGPKQDNLPSKPSKNGRDQFMQMVDWLIDEGITSVKTTPTIDEEIVLYSKKFGENGTFLDNAGENAFSLTASTIYTEEWHIWVMSSSKAESGDNPWSSYGINSESNNSSTGSGNTGVDILSSATSNIGIVLGKYYHYIVPAGQTETFFSFVSIGVDKPAITDVTKQKTYGNFVDNINFELYHPLSGSGTNHGTSIIGGSDGSVGSTGTSDSGHKLTVGDKLSTYVTDGNTIRLRALVKASDAANGCEFIGTYYTKQDENGNKKSILLIKHGNIIEYDENLTDAEKLGKWIRKVEDNGDITYTYYLTGINSATDLHFVFIKNPTITYDANGGQPYIVDRLFNTSEEQNVYSFKPSEDPDIVYNTPETFIDPYVSHAAVGKTEDWKFTGWLLTGDTVDLGENANGIDLVNADKNGKLILPAEHTIACNYSTKGAIGDRTSQYFKIFSGNLWLDKTIVKSESDEILGVQYKEHGEPRLYSNVHNGITMVAQWRWKQTAVSQFKGVTDIDYYDSTKGGKVEVLNVSAETNEYYEDHGASQIYFAELNEQIKLKAITNPGYVFDGWYTKDGDLISTNKEYSYTETLEGVNKLYARFSGSIKQTYERQIFDGTNWIKTEDDTIATLDRYEYIDSPESPISCTVNEGNDYKLVGWFNEDGTPVDPSWIINNGTTISYTTTENAKYLARFDRAYTINFKTQTKYTETDIRNDNIGGKVSTQSYKGIDGETGSCTATANSKAVFIGWYDEDGNLLTTNKTFEQTTNSSTNGKIYYARFEKHYRVNFVAQTEQADGTFDVTGVEGTVSLTTKSGKNNTEANSTASVPEGSKERFIGWFDEDGNKLSDNTTLEKVTSQATDEKTYYARFTKYVEQNFIIQVENEIDGTWSEDSTITSTAAELTTLYHKDIVGTEVNSTATTKEGYKFIGWFDKTGIKVTDNTELRYTTTEDAKYYARFKKTHTIEFIPQLKQPDNSFINSETGGTVNNKTFTDINGTSYSSTATAKDDMKFIGWFDETDTKVSDELSITKEINGNVKYYARFEYKIYSVNFRTQTKQGDTYITNNIGGTVNKTSSSGIVNSTVDSTATANTEYEFIGWFDSNGVKVSDNATWSLILNSNENGKTYYARFNPIEYTIGFKTQTKISGNWTDSELGGNIDITTFTGVKDATVTSKATENTEYKFVGWYLNDTKITELKNLSIILDNTKNGNTYVARFEQKEYTVNFDTKTKLGDTFNISNLGGSLTDTVKTGVKDTIVISEASSNSDYKFVGWYDALGNKLSDNTKFNVTLNITEDGKTYFAHFEPIGYSVNFKIETKVNGVYEEVDLGGNLDKLSGVGISGTVVNSTATSNSDYKFIGWYLNNTKIADTNRLDVTINSVTNGNIYVARFEPIEYTIEFGVKTKQSDNSYIEDTTGGILDKLIASGIKDENITCEATENTEYEFIGWYTSAGTKITDNKILDVTINSGVNGNKYFAYFKQAEYEVNFKVKTKIGDNFIIDPSGGTIDNSSGKGIKDTIVTSSASESEEYKFLGWYDSTGNLVTSNKVLNITLNKLEDAKVYYAHFERIEYTVIFKAQTKINNVFENSTTGGTINNTGFTGIKNDKASSKATANEEYNFIGWYDIHNNKITDDSNLEITLDSSVNGNIYIARFEEKVYTVKFGSKTKINGVFEESTVGGIVTILSNTGRKDTPASSTAMEREDYNFIGWYLDGVKVSDDKDFVTQISSDKHNKTYFAYFEQKEYKVEFKIKTKILGVWEENDLGGNITTEVLTGIKDTPASSIATAKADYTFIGWYDSDENKIQDEPDYSTVLNSSTNNKIFYAYFEPNAYTVNFKVKTKQDDNTFIESNEGGTVTTETYTGLKDINASSKIQVVAGYNFIGWFDETGNQVSTEETLRISLNSSVHNKTYFAHVEKKLYTVNFKVETDINGTWTESTLGGNINNTVGSGYKNTVISSVATANQEYNFLGWYVGNTRIEGNNQIDITLDSTVDGVTYIARFEQKQYTVNFKTQVKENGNWIDSLDGGIIDKTSETGIKDKIVKVKATLNSGYTFIGWYEGDNKVSSNFEYQTVLSSTINNKTYTARFEKLYTVKFEAHTKQTDETFIKDAAGGYVDNTASINIEGFVVTSKATANEGYKFLGWYNEAGVKITDNAQISIILNSTNNNKTYVARFEPIKYKVDFIVQTQVNGVFENITTGGNVSVASVVDVKSTGISSIASENEDFEFIGWYDTADNLVTTSKTINKVINGDNKYYARFIPKEYTVSFKAQTKVNGVWENSSIGGTISLDNKTGIKDTIASSTATEKTGYKFIGWYDSNGVKVSNEKTLKITINSSENNKTYNARFVKIVKQTFLRQLDENGTWKLITDDSIAKLSIYEHIDIEGIEVSSTVTVGSGYEFLGWFDENGVEVPSSSLADNGKTLKYITTLDKTYYARFKEIITPVEINQTFIRQINDGTNWVAVTDDNIGKLTKYSIAGYAGESIEVTATSGTEYKFLGWYDSNGVKVSNTLLSEDGSTLKYVTTTNETYYARFEKIEKVEDNKVNTEEKVDKVDKMDDDTTNNNRDNITDNKENSVLGTGDNNKLIENIALMIISGISLIVILKFKRTKV